jgi:hypothetical protein
VVVVCGVEVETYTKRETPKGRSLIRGAHGPAHARARLWQERASYRVLQKAEARAIPMQ